MGSIRNNLLPSSPVRTYTQIGCRCKWKRRAFGIKEVEDSHLSRQPMEYDLGYVDLEEKALEPLRKSFRAEGVTYVLGTIGCCLCVRSGQK